MRRRRSFIPAFRLRPVVLTLILVGQVVNVTGLPLRSSWSPPKKDKSVPFPCQDRPCGCMSAAQCERSCCCFTPAEKAGWADARRAESEPRGWSAPRLRDQPNKCCRADGKPAREPDGPTWAAGLFVRHCQGNGPFVLASLAPCLPLGAPAAPLDPPAPPGGSSPPASI